MACYKAIRCLTPGCTEPIAVNGRPNAELEAAKHRAETGHRDFHYVQITTLRAAGSVA